MYHFLAGCSVGNRGSDVEGASVQEGTVAMQSLHQTLLVMWPCR